MSVFHNNALIGAGGGAEAATPPGVRSLRFNDDDSAYLNRTPSSASNRKTWSWSAWVKRSALGTNQKLFSAGTGSAYFALAFNTSDQIQVDSFGTGANAFYMHTGDRIFRDTSAWYSVIAILDTTESTGSDRFKLYINGSQVTLTVGTNVPPSNADQLVNSTIEHKIGNSAYGSTSNYFDGYLTDIYFIDGLALTPSSFGSTDSNGVWQRGTYSGTFGTNGFHLLDFENEATIGDDSSGNSNDYTANNLSDTAGAGNDVLLDFPTNGSESDTGAGGEVSGNYATFLANSPVSRACTFSNGNLDVVIGSGFGGTNNDGIRAVSNIGITSGKFYFEHVITGGSKARSNVGVISDITNVGFNGNHWIGSRSTDYIVWSNNGDAYNGGSATSYGVGWTTGDIIGCAFDADAGNLYIYKNGTVMNSGTPAFTGLTNGPYYFICAENNSNITVNFGQRPFEHNAPSGYKCLNTTNLPTPTIADGSDHFDTLTWTATNDSASSKSFTGLSFSPDWVWTKARGLGYNHQLYDVVRGAGNDKSLSSVENTSEPNGFPNVYGFLSSFDSAGFTFSKGTATGSPGPNAYYDQSGTYVAWCWDAGSSTVSNTVGSVTSQVRANQSAGISVVTYTNPSQGAFRVGHGLNADVGMVITKHRNRSSDWYVWHSAYTSEDDYINLNTTDAKGTATDFWGSSPPNSTTFGGNIGTSALAGDTDVAYCFAPVDGFSSFGSYQGSGTSDGPLAITGHRIAWLMIKDSSSTGAWLIWDIARQAYNVQGPYLLADATTTEQDSDLVDFLSNGFKIRTTAGSMNTSGETYIYAAFAENPFQANGGLAR